MAKRFSRSLFIFRRDLRLQDNLGLLAALEQSESVNCAFIFDPRQVEKHKFRSSPGLEFMLSSLEELSETLCSRGGHLSFFLGKAEEVLTELLNEEEFGAVFINADYTPFSKRRDDKLKKVTEAASAEFCPQHDALLTVPGTVHKDDGKPYTVYSFFAKRARLQEVAEPRVNRFKNYSSEALQSEWSYKREEILAEQLEQLFRKGGRKEAVSILKKLESFKDYHEERNFPAIPGTTGLSAHLKFGTVSAREVFHAVKNMLGEDHTIINELYWRDFFTHICWHFPHVFSGAFQKRFDALKWNNNKKLFKAWTEGRTGFPIVDAGMRELLNTGYMHNRVRMIVASFLVKDLHISWEWGEQHFAQWLVDYDPAVNNGNWQWAASTGCDAQPFFRVFNPWSQQKKFDPEAVYIKRWVPELSELSAKEILKLEKPDFPARPSSYPAPIVDHAIQRLEAIEMFEEIPKK